MNPVDTGFSSGPSAPTKLVTHDPQQELWFSQEILPHEPMLRAWLRARFPSLSDNDDVIQESYARLIRARRERPLDDAKGYLFSIARNVVLDLFRRKRTAPMVSLNECESAAVIEERMGVADTVNSSQELELVRAAIEELPTRCREIMVLRKFQGLSNQQIAVRLGLSLNTVNAQLVLGLARCRRYLSDRGVFRGGHA